MYRLAIQHDIRWAPTVRWRSFASVYWLGWVAFHYYFVLILDEKDGLNPHYE